MQMEAGLDNGPILPQEAVIVDASETTASLQTNSLTVVPN